MAELPRRADGRPVKRPESVLVVVHTRGGEVLLLRRADNPAYWQSVTGSMEWGDERPIATAARELREETGIVAAETELRDWQQSNVYTIYPEWRWKYAPGVIENREHIFSLELPARCAVTLNPGEHGTYEWVPLSAAIGRVFSWTNRDVLQVLQTGRGV